MKEGLAALTKLVKVVMSYRPVQKKDKPGAKRPARINTKRASRKEPIGG